MRAFAIPVSTARLTLREFVAADFDAVHAYSSDPRVTRYLFFGPRDKDGSADYLQGLIESQRENPRTRFELAVVETASDKVIGACDLSLIEHGVAFCQGWAKMIGAGPGYTQMGGRATPHSEGTVSLQG